jgi:hypothetical protein
MFANTDLQHLLFGRLSLEDIPYHEPILQVTFAGVAVAGRYSPQSPISGSGARSGATG